MRVWGVVFVVLLAAGCGGGSKQNVPKQPPPGLARRFGDDAQGVDAKPVWFRASDNALLASPAKFTAKSTGYDLDVKAASDELHRLGAEKVFLAGASIGGAAVMAASPAVDPQPAGVLSFSGEPDLLDAMASARRTKAPLLVLLARNDLYTSVASERRFVRAAQSPDKQLVVYSEDWHGWDLLYRAPYKARVNALVLDFLREHSQ